MEAWIFFPICKKNLKATSLKIVNSYRRLVKFNSLSSVMICIIQAFNILVIFAWELNNRL